MVQNQGDVSERDVLEQAWRIWQSAVDPITKKHTYDEVYAYYLGYFPDTPLPSIRRKIHTHNRREAGKLTAPDAPIVDGDDIPDIDPDEMWEFYSRLSERKAAHAARRPRIYFDGGPICIVHIADTHIGAPGADYMRMKEEAEIVRDTPGMYCGFLGDLVDNFIIGKLLNKRIFTNMSVDVEWLLAEQYVAAIAPKLLYTVAGNHDNWTPAISGIDRLEQLNNVAEAIAARKIPYDSDELNIIINVGEYEYPIRLRHQWRLNSMYNAVHDIQQAARLDDSIPFRIAIGAHKHRGAISAFFVHDGETRLAQNCNTYKRVDDFQIKKGFPKNNGGTVVCAILTESGSIIVPESLADAAQLMNMFYS